MNPGHRGVLSFGAFANEILRQLDIPNVAILSEETDLDGELGLDSLQTFELVYVTEEMAGRDDSERTSDLDSADLEFQPIVTMGDLYNYYRNVLKVQLPD